MFQAQLSLKVVSVDIIKDATLKVSASSNFGMVPKLMLYFLRDGQCFEKELVNVSSMTIQGFWIIHKL